MVHLENSIKTNSTNPVLASYHVSSTKNKKEINYLKKIPEGIKKEEKSFSVMSVITPSQTRT